MGIVTNRYGQDELDFDENDQQILTLLQPHIQQAYSMARTRHEMELLLRGPISDELILVLRELGLTVGESHVMFWLYQGCTNKQIAKSMNLSVGTIRKHVENVLRKLGAATRTEACRIAMLRIGKF